MPQNGKLFSIAFITVAFVSFGFLGSSHLWDCQQLDHFNNPGPKRQLLLVMFCHISELFHNCTLDWKQYIQYRNPEPALDDFHHACESFLHISFTLYKFRYWIINLQYLLGQGCSGFRYCSANTRCTHHINPPNGIFLEGGRKAENSHTNMGRTYINTPHSNSSSVFCSGEMDITY